MPNHAPHYLWRGIFYKNFGEYSKAINDLKQALAFKPNNSNYLAYYKDLVDNFDTTIPK